MIVDNVLEIIIGPDAGDNCKVMTVAIMSMIMRLSVLPPDPRTM